MKRSALVRKTPMKRSAMPRHKAALKSGAKRLRSRPRKQSAAELAHLKAVASLPCACCGIVGYSQAAHSNRHQDGKGLGLKANYLATFPLCCSRPGIVGCHAAHDQCIGMTREEADARTDIYIADTLAKLARMGK